MSRPHRYRMHHARTFLVRRFSRSKASRALARVGAIVPSGVRRRGNCHASQSSVTLAKATRGKAEGKCRGKIAAEQFAAFARTIKWKHIRVTEREKERKSRAPRIDRAAREGEFSPPRTRFLDAVKIECFAYALAHDLLLCFQIVRRLTALVQRIQH